MFGTFPRKLANCTGSGATPQTTPYQSQTDEALMTEQIVEKTHALLSPSGAHRWTRCPGSVVLEAGQPDNTSHYARWGTVAHEVAGIILGELAEVEGLAEWSPRCAEGYVGRVFDVEGHQIEFDMELADCVNDYVAHVESFWEPGDILIVEQAVPLEHITGEKGATGTSDCIILKPKQREIVVIDLKGGKGVQVDAENNEQALMYAAGAVEEHDIFHGPFDTFRSVIIQPRLNHVSEWAFDREVFEAEVERLREAAARAQALIALAPTNTVGPDLHPGEKQCKFCKAKAVCPALRGAVTTGLHHTAGPASVEEFADLTLPKQASAAASFKVEAGAVDNDKLAEAMRAAPLIEDWLNAVRAEVERRLLDGQEVPGYYLGVGKRGNRAWGDAALAAERLKAARLKADAIWERKLISPTKAEKLLADAPKVWSKLAPLIVQPDGKPSVCREGDKNERWSPTPAPEDFPEIEEVDPFA